MGIKRVVAVTACAVAITCGSTVAAFAGEITGNGKSLQIAPHTLHGASICAFSGLNDSYSGDPTVPDESGFYRTQNWGQVSPEARVFLAGIGEHPGDACKPSKDAG
jgi:hypothetical protein